MATIANTLIGLLHEESLDTTKQGFEKPITNVVSLVKELASSENSHRALISLLPSFFDACIEQGYETEIFTACKNSIEQLIADSESLSVSFDAMAQGVEQQSLSDEELEVLLSEIQSKIELFFEHSVGVSNYFNALLAINDRIQSKQIWVAQGKERDFMNSVMPIMQRGARYKDLFGSIGKKTLQAKVEALDSFQATTQAIADRILEITAEQNTKIHEVQYSTPKYYFNHLKLELKLNTLAPEKKKALDIIVKDHSFLTYKNGALRIKIENENPVSEKELLDRLTGILSELNSIGILPTSLEIGDVGKQWFTKAKAAYGKDTELAKFLNALFESQVANVATMESSERQQAFNNWVETSFKAETVAQFDHITQGVFATLGSLSTYNSYQNLFNWMRHSIASEQDEGLRYLLDFDTFTKTQKKLDYPAKTEQLAQQVRQLTEQREEIQLGAQELSSQIASLQLELETTLSSLGDLNSDYDELLNELLLNEVAFDESTYGAEADAIEVPSQIDNMANGQAGSMLELISAIKDYNFNNLQVDSLLKAKMGDAVAPACEYITTQLSDAKSKARLYNIQTLQLQSAKSNLVAAQTANAAAEHRLSDVQLRLARARQILAIKKQLDGMKKMFPEYAYEEVLTGIRSSAEADSSTTDIHALFTQYGTKLIASMQATTVEEKQPETVVVEETIALDAHQLVVDEKDRLEKRVAELEASLETQLPTQVVATDAGVSQEVHQAALDTISDLRKQLETLQATANTLPVAEDVPLPVSTASEASLKSIRNLANRSLDDLKSRTGLFGSGGSHKPQQLKALINQMTEALKGEVTEESVALFAKKYLLLIASARKRSFFGTANFAHTKSADKLCEWLTESDNDDAIALAKLMNHSDQAYQSVEKARAALVDLKNNHFSVFELGNANLLNHAENIQVNSK